MTIDVRSYNQARSQLRPSLQSSPHRAHTLIRSEIRTGFLRGNASFAEGDLVASLTTSRNSIRQALRMLAAEGLVDRRPNHGTTVIASICDVAYDELVPSQAFDGIGVEVRQIDHREIGATPYTRQRLQLEGDRVDVAESVISFGQEPRSLHVSYVSAANGQVTRVLDVVPIPQAFERVFGVPLGNVEASIGAIAAGASTSRLLGVAEGSPILLEEVLLSDVDGVPRDLSYTHHRGDRVALSVLHSLQALGEPTC